MYARIHMPPCRTTIINSAAAVTGVRIMAASREFVKICDLFKDGDHKRMVSINYKNCVYLSFKYYIILSSKRSMIWRKIRSIQDLILMSQIILGTAVRCSVRLPGTVLQPSFCLSVVFQCYILFCTAGMFMLCYLSISFAKKFIFD